MIKPKLLVVSGAVLTAERYTYGLHLQYNGDYTYGGTGSRIASNASEKIDLSLKRLKAVDMIDTVAYDASHAYDAYYFYYDGGNLRQDDGPKLGLGISVNTVPKLEELW